MQVIEAKVDMDVVGAIALYVSLLTFTLRVHPDRLDYVDQVLVCSLFGSHAQLRLLGFSTFIDLLSVGLLQKLVVRLHWGYLSRNLPTHHFITSQYEVYCLLH